MFIAIVGHTPVWVWALLAALLALGWSQTRDRALSLTRVTALPLAMLALSLAGLLGTFGESPTALAAWAAALVGVLAGAQRLFAVSGARWSAERRCLHVPGSWWPLGLIVGLFLLKYTVGVATALNPALAHAAGFALGCGLAYGGFSGAFLARAWSLRRLARPAHGPQAA